MTELKLQQLRKFVKVSSHDCFLRKYQTRSIYIINFLGQENPLGKVVQNLLLGGKQKGYKKLLVSRGSMSDMYKILRISSRI